MKLKDVFLGICIAALLVSEVFLFMANRQKDTALTRLNEANQNIAQLQKDLANAKAVAATIQNTDNDRLRKENAKLAQTVSQLQNTLSLVKTQNDILTRQLTTARTAVELQQEHLQQLQTENQQVTAVAQQTLSDAEAAVAQRNTCLNNLRQIDAAKQQWALENGKTADDIPAAADLLPYFHGNVFPVCPAGGVYTINAVGLPPTCSIPGHALPQ